MVTDGRSKRERGMENPCCGPRGKVKYKHTILCLWKSTHSQFFFSSRGEQHGDKR